MSFLVEGKQIVTTLQNPVRCLNTYFIPTNSGWMTKLKNSQHLNLGNITISNAINTSSMQVRLIPKELLHIMHKLFPLVKIQILGNQISCQIISKVIKSRDEIMRRSQYLFILKHIIPFCYITKIEHIIFLWYGKHIRNLIFGPLSIFYNKIKPL